MTKMEVMVASRVGSRIHLARGKKVMFDFDLSELYGVTTSALNQAVKRNENRFPSDFMFRLSKRETENWKSQFVISNPGLKMGLRNAPYAFTEHGVAMLASVLRGERAAQMNIMIVRAFIKLREMLYAHKDLADRMEKLEAAQARHTSVINGLAREIEGLKPTLLLPARRKYGFHGDR